MTNPQKATKHGEIHISGAIRCNNTISTNMYKEYKRLTGMNLGNNFVCFIITACFDTDSLEVLELRSSEMKNL